MDRDLAGGLIWGITNTLELNKLQTCLNDFRDAKHYMEDGWEYVWRLNSEDINNGFIMMLSALDTVPNL